MTDDELRRLFDTLRQENATLRQENAAAHVETRRHIDVVNAATRNDIRLVAEAVLHVREDLRRTESRLDAKIDLSIAETQALIRFSHAQLDHRLRGLEQQRL